MLRMLPKTIYLFFLFFAWHHVAMGAQSNITSPTETPLEKFIQYYKNDLKEFATLIYIQGVRKAYQSPKTDIMFKAIYNQEGYKKDNQGMDISAKFPVENDFVKIGRPLALHKDAPIGYNIVLPVNREIKAIYVLVYGGHGILAKDRMYMPLSWFGELEFNLLEKGIAVVSLNLVDLLKLTGHQSNMSEELHQEIQHSIHYFYETLKKDPQILHEDLQVLNGKPIFLFGGSFGGQIAVRHAEIFPNTFSGYISHDGALSYEVKQRINPTGIGKESSQWLIPMTEPLASGQIDPKVDKIRDPILILHNLDDNRVHVKVSLHWYERAISMGKKELVRLYITKIGNPIFSPEDATTKGHYLPVDQEALENYIQVITSFILNGPSKVPAVSKWVSYKTEIEANKYDHTAAVEEKFLSLAYDMYQKAVVEKSPAAFSIDSENSSDLWLTYYVPFLYIEAYLHLLKSNEIKLKEEMIYLKESKVLTPHILEKGLMNHLDLFLTYLNEKYGFKLPDDLTVVELAKDERLQNLYKTYLTEPKLYEDFLWNVDTKKVVSILSTLYKGNMDAIENGLIQTLPYKNEVANWQDKLDSLKNKLILKIGTNKKHALKTWRGATQAILKKTVKPVP